MQTEVNFCRQRPELSAYLPTSDHLRRVVDAIALPAQLKHKCYKAFMHAWEMSRPRINSFSPVAGFTAGILIHFYIDKLLKTLQDYVKKEENVRAKSVFPIMDRLRKAREGLLIQSLFRFTNRIAIEVSSSRLVTIPCHRAIL